MPVEFFNERRQASGLRAATGVFTAQVIVWGMIRQRLDPKGTLGCVAAEVASGRPELLLPTHKRLTEGTLSPGATAYCAARQRLDLDLADQAAERICNYLNAEAPEALPGLGCQVFLLDGSSIDLANTPELVEAYPPAENQHGRSNWPKVRIVVAHDLVSGSAVQPCWGPMYGSKAVSEQALATTIICRLPARSVVMGDRNFGIFSIAYDADRNGHFILARLTSARARYLLKGRLPERTDEKIDWKPSRWDRASHPGVFPEDACVRGRVISFQVTRQGQTIQLYFFTTLDLPPSQIAKLYGYRWYIETDLRTIKETVHMHALTAKSVGLVAKELVLGMAAYSLVRGVMQAAARAAGIKPRQLSFSQVQNVVLACLPNLSRIAPPEAYQREVDRMLRMAAKCRLPLDRQRPSYPRTVHRRANNFPYKKAA